MERVYEYLKKAKIFYFSTVEGDRPRTRPFGVVFLFEGKLYVQTGKSKAVSRQMEENPQGCVCVMQGPTWLRLNGTLVEDPRPEAQQAFVDAYPELAGRAGYAVGDGNLQVLYFKDAVAEFNSHGKEPEIVRF